MSALEASPDDKIRLAKRYARCHAIGATFGINALYPTDEIDELINEYDYADHFPQLPPDELLHAIKV